MTVPLVEGSRPQTCESHLRDGDPVVVNTGDLAGMRGHVESWTLRDPVYGQPADPDAPRVYWVVLDGDVDPVPFLRGQLLSRDEATE